VEGMLQRGKQVRVTESVEVEDRGDTIQPEREQRTALGAKQVDQAEHLGQVGQLEQLEQLEREAEEVQALTQFPFPGQELPTTSAPMETTTIRALAQTRLGDPLQN